MTAKIFNIGDRVEVLDEGLAMLRKLCPDMPPNNLGTVQEIYGSGELLIYFDDTDSVAPYPVDEVKLIEPHKVQK